MYPRSAGWSPVRALTDGRWKVIVSSRVELYDLARDPAERTDVAEKNPEVVRRIERVMREARVPSKDFPIPALDGKR